MKNFMVRIVDPSAEKHVSRPPEYIKNDKNIGTYEGESVNRP
jgi:hypothetical protein